MENKFAILIIDDDVGLTSNLQDIMEAEGYRIAVANDGQTALTLHQKSIFDLALVDIRLPDMSGANLIKKLAEPSPRVEYIIITGYASLDGAIDAVNQRNIVGYLTKPLNIEYLTFLIRQVSERKKAEDALGDREEKYRSLVNNVSLGVFRSNPEDNGSFLEVNPAMEGITGYSREELLTMKVSELYLHPEEREKILSQAVSGRTTEELLLRKKDGTIITVLDVKTTIKDKDGRIRYFDGILSDITERKKAEEKLILTDRLASIGELAAGIAHELNNPLTSVIGFAQLLLDKDVSDDVKEDIKVIYSEAQRTAEVVKHLLTFSRKHAPVKQLVNINSIIEKVLELRAYEQRVSNIQVNTKLAPDLSEITADYFQLQQVFLNIVINAEHFMIEAHNRGTLTIITERTGDIIRASFTDDGPGISKENLGHLFDPFFTTKEVGKGTGLGLSICHGIITEHHGQIYAESELGKGATFVVELPLSEIDKEGAVE